MSGFIGYGDVVFQLRRNKDFAYVKAKIKNNLQKAEGKYK